MWKTYVVLHVGNLLMQHQGNFLRLLFGRACVPVVHERDDTAAHAGGCTAAPAQADFGSLPEGAPLRGAALAVASVPAPGPALEDAALAVARKVRPCRLETQPL